MILTGLLAMCEEMEIDPSTYLCDFFQHLRVQPTNHVRNLLADNWQAAPAPTENPTPRVLRPDYSYRVALRLSGGGCGRCAVVGWVP